MVALTFTPHWSSARRRPVPRFVGLVNRFFGSSHELLVLNILKDDERRRGGTEKRLRKMLEGKRVIRWP